MVSTRYEILDGLPSSGPVPRWIPDSWRRRGAEGVVLRFHPQQGPPWVGNFRPGMTHCTVVLPHPNGADLFVVAGGQPYVVNPDNGAAHASRGVVVSALWPIEGSPDLLVERQGQEFFRLGRDGVAWHTRRLSWDGFEDVHVGANRVWGQAWSPANQAWHPFSVDLDTGRATGGAPGLPEPGHAGD